MKTGVELIEEERKEQIEKHGFDSQHDKLNHDGSLGQAAVYCLTGKDEEYPEGWSLEWQYKIDRKSLVNRLVVAGALIAAEIDRLQSLEPGKK